MGVEIPNEHREIVRLSEVLASEVYEKSRSRLTLALGHDISGNPVIADLADRKSTRLNSSHVRISYAVFCLKKKNERTFAALADDLLADSDLIEATCFGPNPE